MRFHLYNTNSGEYEINYPNFICMQRVNEEEVIINYCDALGEIVTRRIKLDYHHEIRIELN